jgi:hypothetical protein
MGTEPIQDNLSSARYGAFVIITHLLHAQIDRLSTQLEHGNASNIGLFIELADDMITAITQLVPTPEAADTQLQLLGLLSQHRAFIADPTPFALPARAEALAEISEMDAILGAAIDRLGRRLGLFRE